MPVTSLLIGRASAEIQRLFIPHSNSSGLLCLVPLLSEVGQKSVWLGLARELHLGFFREHAGLCSTTAVHLYPLCPKEHVLGPQGAAVQPAPALGFSKTGRGGARSPCWEHNEPWQASAAGSVRGWKGCGDCQRELPVGERNVQDGGRGCRGLGTLRANCLSDAGGV